MVQFGTIKLLRTSKNYFGQFVWIEKVIILAAFHFMKRRLKIEGNFFSETFLKSPVSRIVPKNVKWGTFLNIHSVAKYQKIEGGPFGDIKKFAKKKSHKAEITCTKNFGRGRDSSPRPSAWETSKNPDYSLCQVPVEVAV